MSLHKMGLISLTSTMLALAACSTAEPRGSTGSAGSTAGTSSNPGTAGASAGTAGNTSAGTAGSDSSGTAGGSQTGMAGSGAAGTGAAGAGAAGTGAAGAGTAGTGAAGSGTAGTGSAGMSGAGGVTGTAGTGDPPAPRPINVTGTGTTSRSFNGQPMYFNRDKKPVMGKLVLFLGGIGGGRGTGSGGIDAFVHGYGFHCFLPTADTSLVGGDVPQTYKDTLKTDPTNKEANRQVGDARMELWDGKDRVTWNNTTPDQSILNETIAMIRDAVVTDPGSDWGYYLNADGTLRTSDVWVVGYSWGAQTWSMISTYVRFGRVIATSGPVDEGFPNGTWMTDPSATPVDRKFNLVGQTQPYPQQMEEIFTNTLKAGWPGPVVNVTLTSPGPYTVGQNLFAMVGGDGGISPGGHTVFCTDNPANKWLPLCRWVFGVQ
jgi:hypothetical protein